MDQNELTSIKATVGNGVKCIHCIEDYVKLKEEQKTPERWDEVQDMVTFVPSWQTTVTGPGQIAMAVCPVPVCLDHVVVKQQTVEQIAQRSGLAIPGIN